MKQVRALIITGFGLNCEAETAYAFEMAGAAAEKVHLNDLLDGIRRLDEFHVLAFIGGFSFGDHLGAGTVFANRLRHRLAKPLDSFIRSGRLIIGICNGFQVMVKLGVLPGFEGRYMERTVTLASNDGGVFRDAWVYLRANPQSPCIFTSGIEEIYLPVRHGEGKLITDSEEVRRRLLESGQVVLQYVHPLTHEPTQEFPWNPNGSEAAIAGICDATGRVFGMMPHPEAYLSPHNHPRWMRQKLLDELPSEGAGVQLFRNAVQFARAEL
jgi:phosphoribosylformylglycinamidine synthase